MHADRWLCVETLSILTYVFLRLYYRLPGVEECYYPGNTDRGWMESKGCYNIIIIFFKVTSIIER